MSAHDQSLVSLETRNRIRGAAVPVATMLGRLGLTPNALTVIGFLGMGAAALAASLQQWVLAGVLVIVFGIFDMFDGALARATNRATRFGAFLDSTLDRTGENLVLAGVAVGCVQAQFGAGVLVAVAAMAFGSIVTYARARAEALGVRGEVGVAPRPERLALIAIGLILAGWPGGFFGFGQAWIGLTLSIVAALSALTVLQRILYVRQQLDDSSKETR
jgi:CDP-diacylglycerol--glycerol-3-phosphate 3-phosphatidyltransferase